MRSRQQHRFQLFSFEFSDHPYSPLLLFALGGFVCFVKARWLQEQQYLWASLSVELAFNVVHVDGGNRAFTQQERHGVCVWHFSSPFVSLHSSSTSDGSSEPRPQCGLELLVVLVSFSASQQLVAFVSSGNVDTSPHSTILPSLHRTTSIVAELNRVVSLRNENALSSWHQPIFVNVKSKQNAIAASRYFADATSIVRAGINAAPNVRVRRHAAFL